VDESLDKRITQLEDQTVASGSNVMAELAGLKEQLKEAVEDADSLKTNIGKLHKTVETQNSNTDELEATLKKTETANKDFLAKINADIALLNKKIDQMDGNSHLSSGTIDQLKTKIESTSSKMEDMRSKLSEKDIQMES
jgi:chromosome segregation ATPase